MPLGLSGRPLELHLSAMEVPVVVRCHGSRADELQAAVVSAWEDCLATEGPRPNPVVIDARLEDTSEECGPGDANPCIVGTTLEDVLNRLIPTITVEAITRNAGRFLMLHACGLADPDTGAVVALVAPSGTGKTTLARTLGKRFGYVSDETVAIRADLGVLAYPKPLSLLDTPDAEFKRQVAGSSLGLRPCLPDLRVAAVTLLSRDPGGPALECTPVRTVQAMLDLTPQISFMAVHDKPLQRVASLLIKTGGLRHVRYREASDLEGLVSDLMATS